MLEVGDALGGQVILTRAGLFNRAVDFPQQVSHFFSPGLFILLVVEGQFTQVMGVAQGVRPRVNGVVGFQVVMHQAALKMIEDKLQKMTKVS